MWFRREKQQKNLLTKFPTRRGQIGWLNPTRRLYVCALSPEKKLLSCQKKTKREKKLIKNPLRRDNEKEEEEEEGAKLIRMTSSENILATIR
jgi:hypothetical protein